MTNHSLRIEADKEEYSVPPYGKPGECLIHGIRLYEGKCALCMFKERSKKAAA